MTEPLRLRDDETAPSALRNALREAATVDPPYDATAGFARFQSSIAAGPRPAGRLLVRVALAGAVLALVAGLALVASRFIPSTKVVPSVAPPTAPFAPSPAPTLPSLSPTPPSPAASSTEVPPPTPAAVGGTQGVEAPAPTQMRRGDPLALELRIVVEARQNIRTRPARSLALLARADREVGDGVLGRERETLRVEALAALGRTDEAARRARAFLAAHPGDPLEARVQTAVGGAQ